MLDTRRKLDTKKTTGSLTNHPAKSGYRSRKHPMTDLPTHTPSGSPLRGHHVNFKTVSNTN